MCKLRYVHRAQTVLSLSLSLVTDGTNGGNVEVFNASRSLRTLTVHDRHVLTGAYRHLNIQLNMAGWAKKKRW